MGNLAVHFVFLFSVVLITPKLLAGDPSFEANLCPNHVLNALSDDDLLAIAEMEAETFIEKQHTDIGLVDMDSAIPLTHFKPSSSDNTIVQDLKFGKHSDRVRLRVFGVPSRVKRVDIVDTERVFRVYQTSHLAIKLATTGAIQMRTQSQAVTFQSSDRLITATEPFTQFDSHDGSWFQETYEDLTGVLMLDPKCDLKNEAHFHQSTVRHHDFTLYAQTPLFRINQCWYLVPGPRGRMLLPVKMIE